MKKYIVELPNAPKSLQARILVAAVALDTAAHVIRSTPQLPYPSSHLPQLPPPTSPPPYACDEPGCEYRAARASDLTRHKRTHWAAQKDWMLDKPFGGLD
jgi:hypothetical protein